MSTWKDDMRKQNPKLAAAYDVVGNQSHDHLRNMVKALKMLPALNTAEDIRRLSAAEFILKNRR